MDIKKIITSLEEVLTELKMNENELPRVANPKSEYINDDYSYEEIKNIADHGLAKDHFKVGDKLKVDRNGKDIIFDVVKVTDTGIVLLSHYLIAQMPFDAPELENPNENIAKYGSNDYDVSSIKQWLNSDSIGGEWWSPMIEYDAPIDCKDYMNGFIYSMNESFIDCLSAEVYDDLFFLPAEEELKEWLPNADKRIKTYGNGECGRYWLRNPYASYSYYVCCVNTCGSVHHTPAYNSIGVAPACVIGEI